MFRKTTQYIGEVKTEIRKCTWPWDPNEKGFKKYKQLTDSTIVILIAIVFLGASVTAIDFAMVHAINLIIGI